MVRPRPQIWHWYSPYIRYENLKNYASSIIKQQIALVDELRIQIEKQERRLLRLVQKLPSLEIPPEKREQLLQAIRNIDGPRRIAIRYLNVPGARAEIFARLLVEIFEAASWHVKIVDSKAEDIIEYDLAIRVEPGAPKIPARVKAIQDAFLQAGLRMGDMHRGAPPLMEEIEIEVGEM